MPREKFSDELLFSLYSMPLADHDCAMLFSDVLTDERIWRTPLDSLQKEETETRAKIEEEQLKAFNELLQPMYSLEILNIVKEKLNSEPYKEINIKTALIRKIRLLGPPFTGYAERYLERLIEQAKNILYTADITINFRLSKVLPKLTPNTDHYMNIYENPGRTLQYLRVRDKAETQMFRLHEAKQRIIGRMGLQMSAYASSGLYTEQGWVPYLANPRFKPSPEFKFSARPVYGALNYLKHPKGSTQMYGPNFLSLNSPKIKDFSSLIPTDSFEYIDGRLGGFDDKLTTFDRLDVLLLHLPINGDDGYMPFLSLMQVADREVNQTSYVPPIHPRYGSNQKNYIEVQMHTRIDYGTYIKNICLDRKSVEEFGKIHLQPPIPEQFKCPECGGSLGIKPLPQQLALRGLRSCSKIHLPDFLEMMERLQNTRETKILQII